MTLADAVRQAGARRQVAAEGEWLERVLRPPGDTGTALWLEGGIRWVRANYVDLGVEKIVRETDAAFLLQLEEGDEVWVPKSQVADAADYSEGDEDLTLSVTSWWADKEGLA